MNRVASILARLILPASVALSGGVALSAEPGQASGGAPAAAPAVVPGSGGVIGRQGIPDRIEPLPPQAEGVSVDEHFGAKLPFDATFKNEAGETVTLGQLFQTGKPVILQLGYFSCPKLCDVIAQKTVDALAEVPLSMGRDYSVLFISIDPNEKPTLAAQSKQSYIRRYTDDGKHEAYTAASGWHFLTGDKDNIDRVTQTVGFNYRFYEDTQQYGHPGVLIMITPDGKVSRYLYGASFDPGLLKLSIVDAASGKSGSVMDKIIMLCVHIDPKTGQYSVQALRIMRLGGAFTVLLLLSMMGLMSLKGRRMRGRAAAGVKSVVSNNLSAKSSVASLSPASGVSSASGVSPARFSSDVSVGGLAASDPSQPTEPKP